jgi:hypothetical protein
MIRPGSTVLFGVTLLWAICLSAAGCRTDSSGRFAGGMSRQQPSDNSTGHPIDTVGLLNAIRDLQDSIRAHPRDRALVGRLLAVALDTSCGCFYSVGTGLPNPTHPESAQRAERKLAAGYAGKRWTLYLKAWNLGRDIPFGQEISGDIVYSSVIYETLSGDTLLQLLQTPLGSIVLRDESGTVQ